MEGPYQGGKLESLRQEWKERIEAGETIPQILWAIKNKTERKLITILMAEELRKNPVFKDDESFSDDELSISPDGKHLLIALAGGKLGEEQTTELEKLGFGLPEEKIAKPRGEEDLPPTKFEEVKKLRSIPIDREFFEIIPYVIPFRLTERNLIHTEILKDKSLHLVYELHNKEKTTNLSFLIPPKILGRIREKDIPTVGVNMRRSLFAALGFAYLQGTTSPNFRRSELLRVMGEDPHRRTKLYSDLEKGLMTWACGTYTIMSGDKILEIGHIVNTLRLPQKRGDRLLVEFNDELVRPLLRKKMEFGSQKYIPYPTELLRVKPREMNVYIRNFCESLLKKQGMWRKVYPKFVKNILAQDFHIPSSKLRKLTNRELHSILMEGIKEAETRDLLKTYKVTKESQIKAGFNIREWKVKLIVPLLSSRGK